MSLSVGRKNRPHVHLELGLKNEGGIWMGRETLKVMDDFYRQDFKVGDIIGLFEGKVKILDMNYQNEFGSFILCEYIEVEDDDHDSVRNMGKPAHPDNPYKVMERFIFQVTVIYWVALVFFIKDRNSDEIIGLTYPSFLFLQNLH
jgi:hypothetical protein